MVKDDEPHDGDIRYLTVEDLVELNRFVILNHSPKEPIGVLNEGGLESAQQRPSQHRYYTQTNDLLLLGAVLLTGLIQNHPFSNGNKRTAFAACRIFLLLNGAAFDPPMGEALEVTPGIANGDYDDEQVASWLSWYTRPVQAADYLEATTDALSQMDLWPRDDTED